MRYLPSSRRWTLLSLLTLCALLAGCGEQSPDVDKAGTNSQAIAGTWVLKARMAGENQEPATQRIIRLTLTGQGTFTAHYRGDPSQKWIRAGDGAFSYSPPLLTLFWDNGATVTLLVAEQGPDHMRVHHGRNLVPLRTQDPDEIFVKQKIERGPTRSPS